MYLKCIIRLEDGEINLTFDFIPAMTGVAILPYEALDVENRICRPTREAT